MTQALTHDQIEVMKYLEDCGADINKQARKEVLFYRSCV